MVLDFIKGSPFKLTAVSFWYVPIILNIFYCMTQQDFPDFPHISHALNLELAILPKNPGSF